MTAQTTIMRLFMAMQLIQKFFAIPLQTTVILFFSQDHEDIRDPLDQEDIEDTMAFLDPVDQLDHQVKDCEKTAWNKV
jgi:hypothetical protein